MKKVFALLGAAAAAIAMSACTTIYPVNATSNGVGSKTGEATSSNLFGFISLSPDGSISTAAKNGGISKISTVDVKRFSILGIYTTYTTIVTGE